MPSLVSLAICEFSTKATLNTAERMRCCLACHSAISAPSVTRHSCIFCLGEPVRNHWLLFENTLVLNCIKRIFERSDDNRSPLDMSQNVRSFTVSMVNAKVPSLLRLTWLTLVLWGNICNVSPLMVCHKTAVLSLDPVKAIRPSSDKATLLTSSRCFCTS